MEEVGRGQRKGRGRWGMSVRARANVLVFVRALAHGAIPRFRTLRRIGGSITVVLRTSPLKVAVVSEIASRVMRSRACVCDGHCACA